MTRSDPIRALFLVLAGTYALTTLGGIALLARMSPAIGEILAANERSMQNSERMLAAVAESPARLEARAMFSDALRAAESNVTEPNEREVLGRIRVRSGAALDGDAVVRRRLVADLLQLSTINRAAMRRADAGARRLGLAGRWALALLGVLGIAGSAWALRRAKRNVLAPLGELASVLDARRKGDLHRRYVHEVESELSSIFGGVNDLLDETELPRTGSLAGEARAARSALTRLLDRCGGSLLLAGSDGSVLAASGEALDALAAHGDRIRAALRDGTIDAWAEEAETIEPGSLLLVTLRAEPPDPSSGS